MATGFVRDVAKFRMPEDDPAPSYARMVYDYSSEDPTYMSVAANSNITVLQKGKDWYRVTDGQKSGFVPASYCELVLVGGEEGEGGGEGRKMDDGESVVHGWVLVQYKGQISSPHTHTTTQTKTPTTYAIGCRPFSSSSGSNSGIHACLCWCQ